MIFKKKKYSMAIEDRPTKNFLTSLGSEERESPRLQTSLNKYENQKITKKREDQRQKLNLFYQNLRDAGTTFSPTGS